MEREQTHLDDTTVADGVMQAAPATTALPEAEFHRLLVALLPRLRVQAFALTRNRTEADDLVQAAIGNALAARHSFAQGTNFGAWMFRILRNRFLSDIRRRRETVDIDDASPAHLSRPAAQEDSLALQELRKHLARLPADQRAALIMVTVQGMSYNEVAAAMGCAVGTAKCRVFRARQQLQTWMLGEERPGSGEGREARREAGVPARRRANMAGATPERWALSGA